MSSTLVRGKYVICKITGPDTAEVISDGAVFQRDGEIVEVGNYEKLKERHKADEIIGSSNCVVMPGLVNNHFHFGLTPFQLGIPDLPLEKWLITRIGTRNTDPYLDHLYGAAQLIRSGVTTALVLSRTGITTAHLGGKEGDIKVEGAERIIRAYQESGMRIAFGAHIMNQNMIVAGAKGAEADFVSQLPADLAEQFKSHAAKSYHTTEEYIISANALCVKYAKGYERIRVVLVPSNVHRCSDDLLIGLKQLAAEYGLGMHIHLQETIYQKLYGLHVWGKTPLQHLNDIDFLGPKLTCDHCVWVTDADIETLVKTKTNVCHQASSNLRLQSGIAPVNRFLERGIRVSIGTDEAGINDDPDMIQEMRLILKLQRVPGIDNKTPTAHQILQMATVNGAYNSGFGDRIGTLEPGKRADIVLMNLQNIGEPYLDPEISIVDAVLHRGRAVDVETVMVDGEIVLRDGKLTQIDIDNVYKELNKLLAKPLSREEMERQELARQLKPYAERFHAQTMGKLSQPHYYYNARA
jgi:cytosine/adenosine deaminase-related metal-dependent hydrolase